MLPAEVFLRTFDNYWYLLCMTTLMGWLWLCPHVLKSNFKGGNMTVLEVWQFPVVSPT